MDKDRVNVESGESLFGSNGQVTEVQAGSMSMIVGVEKTDKFGKQEIDDYEYPEIPEGATSEYDTWLG
jgi:ribosomal protein L30E